MSLVGPDGKELPKQDVEVRAVKTPVGTIPLRKLDVDGLLKGKIDPLQAFFDLACQSGDQHVLSLVGMLMLAKDLYSRQPTGSRHFQDLCDRTGLQIKTLDGDLVSFSAELESIPK